METSAGFTDPPVVETVIGVEFSTIPIGFMGLSRVHGLWNERFPKTFEREALPPTRPAAQGQNIQFQMGTGLPAPRLWMASADDRLLVQVQNDRLLLNWRRLDGDEDTYPHFSVLFNTYKELFQIFRAHIEPEFGALVPLVTEWTYVNRINVEELKGEDAFRVWAESSLNLESQSLFTRFQNIRQFQTEAANGQLEISAEPLGLGADAPVGLTVSAKCFHQPETSPEAALEYAKSAHEMARQAFSAITTDEAQRTWGRTK